MILQALVNYYNILAGDPECDIARPGYSKAKVSYGLNLSKEGELLEVLPLRQKVMRGKKEVEEAQNMLVPLQAVKSSGIKANFLCENVVYVLGIDGKTGKGGLSQTEVEKIKNRAATCHEAFCELHNKLLETVETEESKAVLLFLQRWNPEDQDSIAKVQEYREGLESGANIVFKLDNGRFMHECPEIKAAWEKYINTSQDSVEMQCLVTGEYGNVAILNPKIKNVRNAQSAGASLVSFNAAAYESYGRINGQGLNAPISEKAAFAYGTVLNHLLADRANTLVLGDATIVYWAESSDSVYRDTMSLLFDTGEMEDGQERKRDKRAESYVGGLLAHIASGKAISLEDYGMLENVKFCILGISPNAARLSIRFFMEDSFGGFIKKILQHFEDLKLQRQFENEKSNIPMWLLLKQTVSPKSTDQSASPLLAGSVLRAILTGSPYPRQLFTAVSNRIRAEQDVSYYKIAIIKAYLCRIQNEDFKEVLTVALNDKSTNKAYLLGRLFAVMEKAQLDANPGIKATIKDRYFSSASATPRTVFPILMKLCQHHIAKAEYGRNIDNRIAEITQKLELEENPFPARMSLEEQGLFMLGYYHQKNALYEKVTKEKIE